MALASCTVYRVHVPNAERVRGGANLVPEFGPLGSAPQHLDFVLAAVRS